MPESIRPEKNILAFNQGLNTESSEIAFPDGFTTDERNYELLLDGSRRRRKGLAQESGGSDKTTAAAANGANQTYVWKNVGGDPTKTFVVHKFGSVLYFSSDAVLVSTTYHATTIDLAGYPVTGSSVSMVSNYAQFASGRGYLVVTGKGMVPLAIEWRSATDDFVTTTIYPVIRDYTDQEDGFANTQYPSALSDASRYNLINRGWNEADIVTYNSGASQYPNKSVPWHKGYKETADQSTAAAIELRGVKAFSHALYTGEPASASSAPKGSLFISPRDSTYGSSDASSIVDITTWALTTDHGTTWTVDLTTGSSHGLGVGTVIELKDLASTITTAWGTYLVSWAGTYTTITGTTGSNITLTFAQPYGYTGFDSREYTLGSATTGSVITRGDGSAIASGPRTCAFHDGRLFQAGIDDSKWSDYVFFSQVPDKLNKFKRCYQVADPTDPENNQLVDTDGGWFVIQGIQGVKRMLSVRSSLLVFAENGVWEISGGQRGFFTPSGYSVRKITDVGCNAPLSPIAVENNALYTGPEGVYIIAPNQYTGILEATSVSQDLIQTKWNAIPDAEQALVISEYDSAKKRVLFLYGKNSDTGGYVITTNERFHYKMLILDTNIPAWAYYEYNRAADTGIMSLFAITSTDGTDQANKVKFSCAVTDGFTVRTCDHNQTAYLDYDGSESPLPYAVTGWDSMGVTSGLSSRVETQRRRQAPVITVYSKRTETGYTDSGTGWSGDNESSTLMTPYWDWSDDSISGKVGSTYPDGTTVTNGQQQVYRHTRAFTPSGASDVDGYPVVVTRNKVRGRGRVLQLRFDGEATKDSHIMGFTVNYRAQGSY